MPSLALLSELPRPWNSGKTPPRPQEFREKGTQHGNALVSRVPWRAETQSLSHGCATGDWRVRASGHPQPLDTCSFFMKTICSSSEIEILQQLGEPALCCRVLAQAIRYGFGEALQCWIHPKAFWKALPQGLPRPGIIGET